MDVVNNVNGFVLVTTLEDETKKHLYNCNTFLRFIWS